MTGAVFLNQLQQDGVACFNYKWGRSRRGYIRTNFVERNAKDMVYPSHLSVRNSIFFLKKRKIFEGKENWELREMREK